MKVCLLIQNRLRWLNVPGAVLIALLQRTPAVRVAASAEQLVASSPFGDVLRSAVAVAASLGAIHSMAGATTLSTNSHPSPLSATVGTPITTVLFSTLGTQGPPASWTIGGSIPPGVNFSGLTTAGNVNIASGFFLTLGGTPTTAGSYSVTLKAWENANAKGNFSPTFTYVINVAAAAAAAPSFTTQPTSQTVTAGTSVTFTATASGSPAPTYQWNFNGAAISGATNASYTISGAQAANAGSYTVTATNSAGTATSSTATLTVNPAGVTPVITKQPISQVMAAGSTVVFSVEATNAASYQWRLNGSALSGKTNAMLVLTNVTSAHAGSYTCLVNNGANSATSSAATLSVGNYSAADTGHLINVSVLSMAGPGAKVLTVGAVIGPAGFTNKLPIVMRAVGPTLGLPVAMGGFGVPGVLADPVMSVFTAGSSTPMATNDNWGGGSGMMNAFSSVGAFALPAASLDSAFVSVNSGGLSPGGYTVQVTSSGSDSGTVLAEVYDAGDATRTAATPRLINLSTLTSIDAGSNLTAGFVLRGTSARTLLIRGIGPTLGLPSAQGGFDVGGAMADPKLELFDGASVKIAENDNWGGDGQLITAMASVGAFPLPGTTSKDAVLLVTLTPGSYSARVSDASGAAGTAIVEIYEVP